MTSEVTTPTEIVQSEAAAPSSAGGAATLHVSSQETQQTMNGHVHNGMNYLILIYNQYICKFLVTYKNTAAYCCTYQYY